MTQRRTLIDAALHDPADELTLLALADFHGEQGLPHHEALLRLAVTLRRVPMPDEPHPECDEYVNVPYRPQGRRRHFKPVYLPGFNVLTPDGYFVSWPRCHSWNNAGRLPGMAPAYRLVNDREMQNVEAKAILRRHVLRCELYACGVLSVAERDEENRNRCEAYGNWWWDDGSLWRLRGGRAGRAVGVMERCECIYPFPTPAQETAEEEWRRMRLARARARTYSRDLLRALAAGEAWVHGRGVYAKKEARR